MKHKLDLRQWNIPYIGQRIMKTTVAVFLCLLAYLLLGYRGSTIPTEAAITAIICMQPFVSRTKQYATTRTIGTLIGSFWGLLTLVLLYSVPAIGQWLPLPHLCMAIGVMLSLYSANLLHRTEAASQAAIVFLCIVIAFPEVDAPLQRAGLRIADVFLGTLIAIAVNTFRLPRRKQPDTVYFVRTRDLVPDRFSQITPTVLFRLNRLYEDGAKICLVSEHAPAFFTQQMNAVKMNVPLIVMDGAAIFDENKNCFLKENTIAKADSARVRNQLDTLGLSYFIYTIHRDKTCIFHRGRYRPEENLLIDRMKRSPYRNYLEGEIYEAAEIVYFKIIAQTAEVQELEEDVRSVLPTQKYRIVTKPQAGAEGLSGIYIYAEGSNPETAKAELMKLLRQQDPQLKPLNMTLKTGYRTEHDAIRLLHSIESHFEPVIFRKRRSAARS